MGPIKFLFNSKFDFTAKPLAKHCRYNEGPLYNIRIMCALSSTFLENSTLRNGQTDSVTGVCIHDWLRFAEPLLDLDKNKIYRASEWSFHNLMKSNLPKGVSTDRQAIYTVKKIRRFYGKISGVWLSVLLPLFLRAFTCRTFLEIKIW